MIYIWLAGLTAAVCYIIYNMHDMEKHLDIGIPGILSRVKQLEKKLNEK